MIKQFYKKKTDKCTGERAGRDSKPLTHHRS